MPIYAPGKRDKHNRPGGGGKRNVVAMLSLTAMVDMFTVLVVFLLQNYNTTGEVIEISDGVKLPMASAVKEIKPAHVVVVSKQNIMLDKDFIASFVQVKEQQEWRIDNLYNLMTERFKASDAKRLSLGGQLKDAVDENSASNPADDRRVTVQADKTIDFLTIKKVLATLTEAGASEINFAVVKEEKTNTDL